MSPGQATPRAHGCFHHVVSRGRDLSVTDCWAPSLSRSRLISVKTLPSGDIPSDFPDRRTEAGRVLGSLPGLPQSGASGGLSALQFSMPPPSPALSPLRGFLEGVSPGREYWVGGCEVGSIKNCVILYVDVCGSLFWPLSPLDTVLPADGHLHGTHESISQSDWRPHGTSHPSSLCCPVGRPPASLQLRFRAAGSPELLGEWGAGGVAAQSPRQQIALVGRAHPAATVVKGCAARGHRLCLGADLLWKRPEAWAPLPASSDSSSMVQGRPALGCGLAPYLI